MTDSQRCQRCGHPKVYPGGKRSRHPLTMLAFVLEPAGIEFIFRCPKFVPPSSRSEEGT